MKVQQNHAVVPPANQQANQAAAAAPAAAVAAPAAAVAAPAAVAAAPAAVAAAPAAAVADPAAVAAAPAAAVADPATAAAAPAAVVADPQAAAAASAAAGAVPQVDPAAPPAGAAPLAVAAPQMAVAASQMAAAAPPQPAVAAAPRAYEAKKNANNQGTPAVSNHLVGSKSPNMIGVAAEFSKATTEADQSDSSVADLQFELNRYNHYLDAREMPAYSQLVKTLYEIELRCSNLVKRPDGELSADLMSVAQNILTLRVKNERTRLEPQIKDLELRIVPEDPGTSGGLLRHLMSFRLMVNYPDMGIKYDDDSLGGMYFQYWEEIKNFYNFASTNPTEIAEKKKVGVGSGNKPWNDIYSIVPSSATFNPNESQKASLKKCYGELDDSAMQGLDQIKAKARDGRLTGSQQICFVDRPGISVETDGFYHRQLNFRVVFYTANGQRKELTCNQELKVEAGAVAIQRMNYGSGTRDIRISADKDADVGGLSADFVWGANIPKDALEAVMPFSNAIEAGSAMPFDQYEFDQARQLAPTMPNPPDGILPHDAANPMVEDANVDALWGAEDSPYHDIVKYARGGAGTVGLARPQPGFAYYQHPFAAGRMLVAVVAAGVLRHLYYTDGKINSTSVEQMPKEGAAHQKYQINTRQYQELPTEILRYAREGRKTPGYAFDSAQASQNLTKPSPANDKQIPPDIASFTAVNLEGMNFGSHRAKWDKKYQQIKKAAIAYNAAVAQNTDAQSILQTRSALMNCMSDYMMNKSFSAKKEESPLSIRQRMDNVSGLFYQLAVSPNSKGRAGQALTRMTSDLSSQSISAEDFHRNQLLTEAFGGAINDSGEGGNLSQATKATIISTLGMLDTTALTADKIPIPKTQFVQHDKSSGGGTSVDFTENGETSARIKLPTAAGGNTRMQDEWLMLGSTLHEVTHLADYVVYNNTTSTLGIPPSDEKTMLAEIKRRQQIVNSVAESHAQSEAEEDVVLLRERLNYAGLSEKLFNDISTRIGNRSTLLDTDKDTLSPKQKTAIEEEIKEHRFLKTIKSGFTEEERDSVNLPENIEKCRQQLISQLKVLLQSKKETQIRKFLMSTCNCGEGLVGSIRRDLSDCVADEETKHPGNPANLDVALGQFMTTARATNFAGTALLQRSRERANLNMSTLTEYDAVFPQLMLWMELRGEDKTHSALYNKIRAVNMQTMLTRMQFQEEKQFGNHQ